MPDLQRGLYEALLTDALARALRDLPDHLRAESAALADAEAADRLALHVGRLVAQVVDSFPDAERARRGARLAGELVRALAAHLGDVADEAPREPGELLRAITTRAPGGGAEILRGPALPLLDTALLTNAPGEPRVGHQLESEVDSADAIDLVMAFIRLSGVAPLRGALDRHLAAGRALRVLTTTYTGSTEARALDLLAQLGAEVRVSYDTSTTRLHAKAWLFHRSSGLSTAYVGSSNLTHSAQVTGLEWNLRVSAARNPTVVEKIRAVFDSYWASGDFVPYDADEFQRRAQVAAGPSVLLAPVELRPEPFQARMLEQLAAHRARGHHRNLLVSATGTGKTVMAALDYASLCVGARRPSLLFVAHRRELLDQAMSTFRYALRDATFGELWVDGARPREHRHVFASIQSLAHADLAALSPDRFDVVIVDEFHHAAAPSYRRLLDHLRPTELLGLTATPERADGLSILAPFDGRIAAELRLWDAIDQRRLVPFQYYGVADGTDLREVPFRRGQGYDVDGLTRVYTASDAWARLVLHRLLERADDPARMRALGFCVSVAHARFMARVFSEAGVPSVAVWGDSPPEERRDALLRLREGSVRAVFSVDLLNEGVDLPEVDTLLLLRPTESATLFLQQLGRGLRRAPGKAACLVLDPIGQHRREFRFDLKLRALLGGSRRDVERQVEQGFPLLPAGCHLALDRVARDEVLRSLRRAVPSGHAGRVEALRALLADQPDIDLRGFLREARLEPEDVYDGGGSWSDVRRDAGCTIAAPGPHEPVLRRAVGRLLHVDDADRLALFRRLITEPDLRTAGLSERERRLTRMLVGSLAEQLFRDRALDAQATIDDALDLLRLHPQVVLELGELLDALEDRLDHAHPPPVGDLPLRPHARYTRLEILAGLQPSAGARIPKWQTGVQRIAAARADVFAFTLDKSGSRFSPTTRYRDYAISRDLIHWESQGVTRADSETGLRYRQHEARGDTIHLFGRVTPDARAFWYLGQASYVSHEGERPMAITWRLHHPLPADLFGTFAAAVA